MATHSTILACRIPMDRGAWWATVHGVVQSQIQLNQVNTHTHRTVFVHYKGKYNFNLKKVRLQDESENVELCQYVLILEKPQIRTLITSNKHKKICLLMTKSLGGNEKCQ